MNSSLNNQSVNNHELTNSAAQSQAVQGNMHFSTTHMGAINADNTYLTLQYSPVSCQKLALPTQLYCQADHSEPVSLPPFSVHAHQSAQQSLHSIELDSNDDCMSVEISADDNEDAFSESSLTSQENSFVQKSTDNSAQIIQSKVSDLNKKEHQTSTFDDSDTCDSEVDRQVEMFMKRFDEGKVSNSGFKEIPKTCNSFADCQVKVGSDQAMRSKVSFRPANLPKKVFRDFEGNYNFKTDKNRVRREIYKAKKAKEMKSKAVAQKRGCYSDSED